MTSAAFSANRLDELYVAWTVDCIHQWEVVPIFGSFVAHGAQSRAQRSPILQKLLKNAATKDIREASANRPVGSNEGLRSPLASEELDERHSEDHVVLPGRAGIHEDHRVGQSRTFPPSPHLRKPSTIAPSLGPTEG